MDAEGQRLQAANPPWIIKSADTLGQVFRDSAAGEAVTPAALAADEPPSDAAMLRMVLGVVGVASLLIGLTGLAFGGQSLRTCGLLVFMFLGVGSAPWQLRPTLRRYERLVLTFVTSLSVMTLAPVAMLLTDFWQPGLAFAAIAAVCLPLHVIGVTEVIEQARSSPVRRWPSRYRGHHRAHRRHLLRDAAPRRLPITLSRWHASRTLVAVLPATAVASTGAALSLVSALRHRHLVPDFYGFPREVGLTWFVGITLVLVALTVLGRPEHSRAIPMFLLVLCLTLTPALTYDGPRSQSAAKHVDFVLQIQSLHELTSSVPIYNAYAGFFAAMAWLCAVTGIPDPIVLATFWPALLGVFRVIVLRYLAGQLLPGSVQPWVAVILAVLADSISADYFSPQSVGFTLGLAVFGIALSKSPDLPRLGVILLAGLTLAVTHQLSPYVVGGVLFVLAGFRLVRPWWTPMLILGPAVVWASLHWGAVDPFFSLDAFGRIGNFSPPKAIASPALDRLPVVRATVVALLVGVLLVGALAAVTLIRHRREARYWALACCPAVGLVLVAINPYGQEGIFRATLFGLPWLAVLASSTVLGSGLRARLGLFFITASLLTAFLISSFGLDAVNVIRPGDLAAMREFRDAGGMNPPNPYYLLLLNPGDQPTSPGIRGGKHFIWHRDMIREPVEEQPNYRAEDELDSLTAKLVRYTEVPDGGPHIFALWSPAGARYGQAYALRSLEQSTALRDAFRNSPFWSVRSSRDGTYLFAFEPQRYPGGGVG